jgi:hypothetical protein
MRIIGLEELRIRRVKDKKKIESRRGEGEREANIKIKAL